MSDSLPHYAVSTDYDRNAGRRRDYLTVWSGAFASDFEAEGVSLPKRDGYMLTTRAGAKVRVACPIRTDETWQQTDAAIARAMYEHARQAEAIAHHLPTD